MARNRVEKNIAKDDKRNVYYVYLYYGTDEKGKAIRNTVTTSSLKEARAKLKEHMKQMQAGTAIPPAKDTLSECMKDFIDYKAALLAESTIYGYTNIWKNHIAPYFGKKRIQDVTAKDIQDYIGHKSKTELSNASIKKHLDLMYSVFNNAYINRLINENPMDRMERFKGKSSQMDCMNMNEIAQLCLSVKGTQLEVPVVLAAYLGLRRGEILGLKWEHIDFENATLYVENTRTMVGKKVVEKSPKTERSTRQLNLNDYLLQMLLDHKKVQFTRDYTG